MTAFSLNYLLLVGQGGAPSPATQYTVTVGGKLNKMKNSELIEVVILNGSFRDIGFSKSALTAYTRNEELKNEVFSEIENIKSYSELVCDRLRTMGNSSRKHFVKLLSKKYEFSNDLIYGKLYDYGMTATR